MKTKKPAKKLRLTPLQKEKFICSVYYYFLWVEDNGDLVDPYVLDVSVEPEPIKQSNANISPRKPKTRKIYHINPLRITRSQTKDLKQFKKSKIFKFASVTLILLASVVLLQLAYPRERALPLARLQSQGFIGFADKQKVLKALSDFDQRIVTVHTHTKNITTSYKDLGVAIDPEATANQVTDYPLSKRFLPFSIIFGSHTENEIHRSINQPQLDLFVKDVVAQASKEPVDALVTIDGTKINLSPAEDGFAYQTLSLQAAVLKSDLRDKGQVVFTPTVLYPNIPNDIAQTNASRMQQRISSPLTIIADGKKFDIDSKILASWIKIEHRPDKNTVFVGFDENKISESLAYLPPTIDYSAVPSVTTMLNGASAGKSQGTSGRTMDFAQLIKILADTTSPATSSIEAPVAVNPPPELIERKYTKDSLGMQSLLEYWTSNNGGQYGIDFRTINGRISANINPNRLFPAVGVHKTYIASLIYNRIAAGSLQLSTITYTGNNVDNCLYRMISLSDEACTNALGDIVGWSASDSLLLNQGFESTTITKGASLTTANDSTDWLIKLYSGNITTLSHSYMLTDLMAGQSIRSGVPAGSIGYRVENKSGSYGRTVNDIAIVYHSGGTYALSILSEGGSYSKFADLAKEINKVMAQ